MELEVASGFEMVKEGADLIEIGDESTAGDFLNTRAEDFAFKENGETAYTGCSLERKCVKFIPGKNRNECNPTDDRG